jgi:hypothetical protein
MVDAAVKSAAIKDGPLRLGVTLNTVATRWNRRKA